MDTISFICGISSSLIGLVNFIPQLVVLYTNKRSTGISFYYICIRILCHSLNIISGYHKKIPIILVLLSIYHFLADIIFLYMVIYYSYYSISSIVKYNAFAGTCIIFSLMSFILINDFISDLIAWIASSLFIISLFPLIIKIVQYKSVENLSFHTFVLKYISLVLHLASVIFSIHSHSDIMNLLPWLTGMSISCILELFVFYLFYRYQDLPVYERLHSEEEVTLEN